mgnify:CR=1 FL=1
MKPRRTKWTGWSKWSPGASAQEVAVACGILAMAAAISAANPQFLALENLLDLVSNYAFTGILAAGLLVVLVSGDIDISFIAIATVAQYLMAASIVRWGGNVAIAFAIAAAAGLALGLVNAGVITLLRIPGIVATIATLNIFHGLLIFAASGRWIYNLPGWFREFGQWKVVPFHRGDGTTFGLSIMAVVLILVIAATAGLLRCTMLGRSIYAMGGNAVAARRVGFNVARIRTFVYGYMGLLAGLAGLVHALDVQTVAPNALVGKELGVFAAVVLGGSSLTGGVGTVRGTVLGVAFLAVLSNGLTLARVPSAWYQVAIGMVLLVSVTVGAYQSGGPTWARANR